MNGLYLFRLKNIPVFVSGWYLLLLVYFGLFAGSFAIGMLWAGAVTVSILVHEFGHALMARKYELQPQVLLHGMGGLCAHRPASRDKHSVLILIAGPGAGLVLGAIFWAIEYAILSANPGWLAARPYMAQFLWVMIYINLLWSVLNLIPLWPLDGGQLFQIGLSQKLDRVRADKLTHGIGIAIAAVGVIWGLSAGWFFLAVLSGLLGYSNYSRFKAAGQRKAGEPRDKPNQFAETLYDEAIDALQSQDWGTAIRLAHQMRAESLTPAQLHKTWELLAVAHANNEEWEEALRFAGRAPQSEAIVEVQRRAAAELEAGLAQSQPGL